MENFGQVRPKTTGEVVTMPPWKVEGVMPRNKGDTSFFSSAKGEKEREKEKNNKRKEKGKAVKIRSTKFATSAKKNGQKTKSGEIFGIVRLYK